MNNELFLIVDYRGHFYSSTRYRGASMDVNLLKRYFTEYGYNLIVKTFHEIDFRTQNYKGQFILYQSSEDRDSLYKGYIEDILLGLKIQGAILLPDFYLFRAHHNKVFMEILRDLSSNPGIKNIRSKGYGTLEDFLSDFPSLSEELVMKPSSGAMSRGVKLLTTEKGKIAHARKLSSSFDPLETVKYLLKPYIRQNYVYESTHREKFITQNMIHGIQQDYKILIYGYKYYLLCRHNRKGDFRASGSGLFERVDNPPNGLLDYAESVYSSFNCPFISLDIALDKNNYYLFEFQFLMFGQLTLEKSTYYFKKQDNKWITVQETPSVEREISRSVVEYIARQS